jgi:beta-glucosidase
VRAARQADVAVVFAAKPAGEGHDALTLSLPGDQDALISAVARANPRTVVVLHTSNPVAMPWLDEVAAVVQAWYPGQAAGASIASVLFGDVNPSGKLPMTFPANEHQGPGSHWLEYPGDGTTVDFDEGVLVGYRWYDAKAEMPLFPFGYGLSYTTFELSDLEVEGSAARRTVRVRVTNTGRRAGAEVVQLYVAFPEAAREPPRQLKGFEKLRLEPGESRVATLRLDETALSAWDEASRAWKLFPGTYTVSIGSSSRDLPLEATFDVGER